MAFGTMPLCLSARLSCPLGSGVNVKPLFVLFWQLCRFQKGPQDVPYSQALLVVLLLAEVSLGLATILFLGGDYFPQQALGMIVAISAWIAMVWGILNFKGLRPRFVQAVTACLGTDLLMSFIILPLQVFIVTQPSADGVGNLVRLAMLFFLIWDILIKARIYSVSMELGRLQGNLLSISIWILVLLLSNSFIPPEALEALQQSADAGAAQ